MDFLRYYRTIKYLKPSQIAALAMRGRRRPKADLSSAPPQRKAAGRWTPPVPRQPSMLSPTRFRFFNVEEDVQIPGDWNSPESERLWLYNLHYFDYINTAPVPSAAGQVMERWIQENPPGEGAGWEPYPLSLRIVNWIKFLLAVREQLAYLHPEGLRTIEKCRQSLAVQARFLSKTIEYHLLANHLFANAKALVFAGLFFEGRKPSAWLAEGLSILDRELDEQILPDGGHFERSPMCHAVILEDLLDLANMAAAYPRVVSPELVTRLNRAAAAMFSWLRAMTHPDGRIALFNDAAFGGAAEPHELAAYAGRLGLAVPAARRAPLVRLADSGYFRAEAGPLTLIADAGPLGPDYQPGHGHADTLSFELSSHKSRIIVDTGTSTYERGAQRLLERSTAAHNTIEINMRSSSEMWESFRVARRARVVECRALEKPDGSVSIAGAHDGYRRPASFTSADGIGLHKREFVLSSGGLEIKDIVTGKNRVTLRMCFHFHPGIVLEKREKNLVDVLGRNRRLIASCEFDALFRVRTEPFDYHPMFGLSLPSHRILCAMEAKLPVSFYTLITCPETV
ncbi:MAG: alginate lyase family protein [Chitinispirillaceae bacterium]|nr:alginate lyase family protein [Chitinispirillaceae bacterium]